jgi:hypothetical protein
MTRQKVITSTIVIPYALCMIFHFNKSLNPCIIPPELSTLPQRPSPRSHSSIMIPLSLSVSSSSLSSTSPSLTSSAIVSNVYTFLLCPQTVDLKPQVYQVQAVQASKSIRSMMKIKNKYKYKSVVNKTMRYQDAKGRKDMKKTIPIHPAPARFSKKELDQALAVLI